MRKENIQEQLQSLSLPWRHTENTLTVNVKVGDFTEALDKITQIGQVAEELNHHPDISLHDYNQLTITTTTHSEGEVTDKDIELATRIDPIINP